MVSWLSLCVAALALIVTIIGQGVSIRANGRQTKALEREEQERKDDFRRVQGATLVADQSGSFSGSSAGVDYPARIRNLGPAPARNVQVWIAERLPDGELVGAVTNPESFTALIPEDGWRDFTLHQPPRDDHRPREGVIVAYWEDGNGRSVHRDRHLPDRTVESQWAWGGFANVYAGGSDAEPAAPAVLRVPILGGLR